MRHLAREFSSNRRWYTCQSMPPSKAPSVWSRHIPRVMKNTWHIENNIGKTLQKWSQKLSSSFSPVWHTSQTSKLFLFANLPLMKLSKHSRWSMLLHWQGHISSLVLVSLLQWRHRIGAIENIETGWNGMPKKSEQNFGWTVLKCWNAVRLFRMLRDVNMSQKRNDLRNASEAIAPFRLQSGGSTWLHSEMIESYWIYKDIRVYTVHWRFPGHEHQMNSKWTPKLLFKGNGSRRQTWSRWGTKHGTSRHTAHHDTSWKRFPCGFPCEIYESPWHPWQQHNASCKMLQERKHHTAYMPWFANTSRCIILLKDTGIYRFGCCTPERNLTTVCAQTLRIFETFKL